MLLGGVFKATGNASPVTVPAKGRWMFQDMARWARRYGVSLAMNPHFPINTLALMRIAVGLQMRQPADFERYVDTVFRAMWETPCNMGDAAVLAQVLQRAGFDAEALLALAGDPEVKARLVATTEEAVARGVFGAPTMFVGEQMFFGQDPAGVRARSLGRRRRMRYTGRHGARRISSYLESGAGDKFFEQVFKGGTRRSAAVEAPLSDSSTRHGIRPRARARRACRPAGRRAA
jgi:2-hydroxychromene-2-carboxylate isomerase